MWSSPMGCGDACPSLSGQALCGLGALGPGPGSRSRWCAASATTSTPASSRCSPSWCRPWPRPPGELLHPPPSGSGLVCRPLREPAQVRPASGCGSRSRTRPGVQPGPNERSSTVTTWVVAPQGPGCRVRLEGRWQGERGRRVGRATGSAALLRWLYAEELERLDRCAWMAPPRLSGQPGRRSTTGASTSRPLAAALRRPSMYSSLPGWGWSGHAWPMPMPMPVGTRP
jgi:hypothetical protein